MQNPRPRGLGLLADFINTSGPSRVKVVRDHISWVDTPSKEAHSTYGRAERALKDALDSSQPQVVLDRMVNRASDQHRRHYEELAAGALRFIEQMNPTRMPVPVVLQQHGRLQVKINHVIGLEDRKGKSLACFLYFKEPELTTDSVAVITRLIETEIDRIYPGAQPAALDVRRGKLMKRAPQRKCEYLDMLIRTEVQAYLALWDEVQGFKRAS